MSGRLMSVVVAGIVLLSATAWAIPSSVPQTMNYQVMLTDDAGEPLPGAHTLVFRLYEVESGGSDIWTETHSVTANSIGVVSVVLGSDTPLTESFAVPYWVEVEVDGEVMSPRRELTSAPYALCARDADQLGGATPSEYATDDELSTVGVINTVSNPVDWTRLKNVPAGIADGVDDAGGVGDGYSLDASDGSPVDALYVNPGGDVGIGTTAPQRELSIYRDGGALVYSHYTNGTTGANSSDGLICGINGSGNTFLWNHEDTPLTFGTNNVSRMKLTETGVLELGNETVSDGRLELYRAGTTGQIYRLGDIYDDGASFHLYNDTPLRYAAFEPDAAGVGGAWVHLSGSAGSGLTYDGNYSSEPRLTMSGTGQYFDFSFNLSGDASVTLPTSSISASEVLDEAGAANITDYTTVYLVEGIQVLESRTITAPAPGYILAIATGEFSVTHTNGITSRVDIGVSDASGSWPSSNDVDLQVSSNAPSGIYAFPVTVHGFFETSGGSKTIYFLADEQSSSVATMDRNFTLIYVPTAYGTVDPDLAVYGESDEPTNERSALTESDIALERSQSEADNQSRIERELEEMRARLAALEAEVASQH